MIICDNLLYPCDIKVSIKIQEKFTNKIKRFLSVISILFILLSGIYFSFIYIWIVSIKGLYEPNLKWNIILLYINNSNGLSVFL